MARTSPFHGLNRGSTPRGITTKNRRKSVFCLLYFKEMSVLEVTNLTKKFGNFTAVDNISFKLGEGEILGMLGPNGAGKTTTLQMLLGALTTTGGRVSYFGKDFKTHREEILEQINFSSTYIDLPYRLTVKECLTYISYLYDIPDRKKRIQKIVDIFDLGSLFNKNMYRLSAGQKTRVGLAKAMLNLPKVLLLDEPTASLDPEVAKFIREFLINEQKQFKMSVLITSHNMAEVEELCDRVVFINHGKIVADDKPLALARTINISHVELWVTKNKEKLLNYCTDRGLVVREDGQYTIIDVNERGIPDLLKDLIDLGVSYEEISIAKPTLEDYFLQMAKAGKESA